MITILHGDDTVKSRLVLEDLKKEAQGREILSLDGRKTELNQLKQVVETNPMFNPRRLIVVENISQNKKLAELTEYLKANPSLGEMVFWEDKEVSKSFLAKFPAKVLLFKPEAILFKFLEAVRPNNQRQLLNLLRLCLRSEPPEIIFHLLVRQFRLLIALKEEISSGIEELERLAPWQKQKISSQAKNFSLENLLTIYHQLLTIDYQQKTGQNPQDLAKTLEFFILNI